MAGLEVGLKGYAETMVDESNVASSVGSGLLDVFSTPSMIALMEKACKESVAPFLDEGQGTVGIRLEVDHLAATPIGQKVWVDSELIAVDKRILTFAVTAWSEKEKIGEGIHKRCVILNDRFLEKMKARYGE
jgi:predicted thioesterase